MRKYGLDFCRTGLLFVCFQAPPNLVSKGERSSAENILLEFRKTRNAFALCKFILGETVDNYCWFVHMRLVK